MQYSFRKIKKSLTLSEEIQQEIEKAILDRKFLPGEKLPTEHELCRMFGVSRTALREAIQKLTAKGLITVRKGSGTYIADFSGRNVVDNMRLYLELNFEPGTIKELIQVRKLIEPPIAALAARNRDQNDLKALERNMEKFRKVTPQNFREEGEIDGEFHRLIAQASGNHLIMIIVEPLFQLIPHIRTLVYERVDRARSSALEYHSMILESIRKQDEEQAYRLMMEHIQLAQQHSLMVLENIKKKEEK